MGPFSRDIKAFYCTMAGNFLSSLFLFFSESFLNQPAVGEKTVGFFVEKPAQRLPIPREKDKPPPDGSGGGANIVAYIKLKRMDYSWTSRRRLTAVESWIVLTEVSLT